MNVDKKQLIDDICDIDFNLTEEEQKHLDSCIYEKEKKVKLFYNLKTHCLLLSLIVLITMFSFSFFIIQLSVILILIGSYLLFQKKHFYHSCVLKGMKQPIEDFVSDTIMFIKECDDN
jgi:hypothetical protein